MLEWGFSMHLLLFRHGIAEDVGPEGDDASRRLTREGIEKTKAAVAGLSRLCERPDALFTSPLIRADQTAAILAQVYDLKPRIMHALATGPAPLVMHELRKIKQETVILVGHEPTLGELGSILCAGGKAPPFIEMKKAGAMLIQTDVNHAASIGAGRLLWLATPGMLRAMA
jgi:phosphohistidine phosphatase